MVYGATPAGIAAAISAADSGSKVLLVEPTRQVGGLVTSGLSHTDFHSLESLTGSFLDFSQRVKGYYAAKYGPDSPQVKDSFHGTFGEPHVNRLVFEKMLQEAGTGDGQGGISLLHEHSLAGIQMSETPALAGEVSPTRRIARVSLIGDKGSLRHIAPRVVIDATYEGDLMAAAGVPSRWGREGREEYGESLAPEQPDTQLQAYNFRFCMTRDPANRTPPIAPPGYRREDFVGVLAALETGRIKRVFGYPKDCLFKAQTPTLPNGKYDINDVSGGFVRLSLPGKNLGWPDGREAERMVIIAEHLRDQAGLVYFLQTDRAVPEIFQREALEWGYCRDEFAESNHFPPQLYVREARRMVGRHVFTQRDSEHAAGDARAVLFRDSIAMGDYGNNCHGTFHEGPRFGGKHTGEFYLPVPPYQIPYGVIVPNQVSNLLVPGAVSSSHVGFCALRLEPIWMSLGQAAGVAAAMVNEVAPKESPATVHAVNAPELQRRLHAAGSATIYISDIPPSHADFAATQWWGTLGGFHGIEPMPAKPGQRGANLFGQYFQANPGHAANLDLKLEGPLHARWIELAKKAGLEDEAEVLSTADTRGEFVRLAFAAHRDGR
ncbi:MAG: xanthan lyase [Planctomyces sp.]|nr:xanthan lyase [Planctomyces sp.]